MYLIYVHHGQVLGLNHESLVHFNVSFLVHLTDTTKPVIHSLPSETIYKDIMIPVSLPVLSYTDNFGVSKTTASDPIRPGDITTDSITITYTAEDYDGNVAMGNIVIEVIGIVMSENIV